MARKDSESSSEIVHWGENKNRRLSVIVYSERIWADAKYFRVNA